ncbi:MAG: hypothetical protein ACYTGX_17065 [Planctomycetota bacterium]|jgi:hypothetical protein
MLTIRPLARRLAAPAGFVALAALLTTGGCTESDDPAPAPVYSSGQLVSGFGSGGVAYTDPSTRGDAVGAALVVGGDRLLVVGSDESPANGDHQWRIEKWCY